MTIEEKLRPEQRDALIALRQSLWAAEVCGEMLHYPPGQMPHQRTEAPHFYPGEGFDCEGGESTWL